jgi:hypothetical protein
MRFLNLLGAACCALVLALPAGRASAQAVNMYYRNQMNNAAALPPAQTQASAGPTTPPPPNVNVNLSQPPAYAPAAPYGAGYGYGYPTYSPYGGALNGVANVTNANGQYLMQTQQARQTDQQVQQAKIDTQRKLFDERNYELAHTPTLEELRMLDMQAAYQRSMNNPPNTEVWDGSAPNNLLKAAQASRGAGMKGPAIPLDPQLLQKLNFTTGSVRGGAGALTSGMFDWPLVLTRAPFDEDRKKLEELTTNAVKQAGSGRVPPATLDELNATVKAMQAKLDSMINDLTPDDCIKGTRYLRELKQGFGVLGAADASAYLDRGWLNGVRTLPQLIDAMTQRGLTFAPAAPGGEAAYTALHSYLVNYDAYVDQVAKR